MKRVIFLLIIFLFAAINIMAQGSYTDPRDGNTYRTITISGKTWMAENMKYFASGRGAFFFDNNLNNVDYYGVLYEWRSAMNACPAGWHLPTGSDFRTLANIFEIDAEWKKDKAVPVSFGIQLAGMKDYEGIFTEIDESAYFWTSTEYDKDNAEYFSYMIINDRPVIDISREEDIHDIHGAEKANRYSVRCIRD